MASAFDPFRKFVRVTGERDDGFVEFDFALGEPELFAEMMLTRAAFDEFCAAQDVVVLDGAGGQPGSDAGPHSPLSARLDDVLNSDSR
ncbi:MULTISPECIES: phenol hydroxylase subunit [Methyloversatilis]|jgi:phenol/toluene 2-monooxygenase (NADH) P0/A0|uniref:phenol hydroxylase subunit n=1 Tax=Methyloversatilis TaxID=378210 RepID=UPI00035E81B8|nr:phenol hydroxylase subunit [Methyloversatilis discipulorum]